MHEADPRLGGHDAITVKNEVESDKASGCGVVLSEVEWGVTCAVRTAEAQASGPDPDGHLAQCGHERIVADDGQGSITRLMPPGAVATPT